ncbi:MAG: hypothetical protein Kow00121_56190 [Elainellaceae cyanobacterium]
MSHDSHIRVQYKAAFVTLADPSNVLVPFYKKLFGQAPALELPDVYAEFKLAGLRLGIFKPKASHCPEFEGRSSGGMSLCLEVADLEAAIAYLTQLGYPPPGAISHASHGREIYAYDPLGNRLILHEASAL